MMKFREAITSDVRQIQIVRNSVKENVLSDPALVTDADCIEYIAERGKGWVCEKDGVLTGFAIADLKEHNIWALFVSPEFEKQGIGRKLHDMMLNWYFTISDVNLWLGTDPGTRAEKFYRKAGWKEIGIHGKREIKFEMTKSQWLSKNF